MNLTGALTRWSELEPERCFRGNGYYKLPWHAEFSEDEIPLELLEYAVREAIEARTLDWRVWHRCGLDYGEVSFFDREAGLNQWSKTSTESAAHALLLAYIAYLESLQPNRD